MLVRRVGTPLLGVVVAASLYPATRHLDDLAREGQLGPGFWPRLALLGLVLASVAKAVEEWQRARGGAGAAATRPPIATGKLGVGIALIVAYAALAPVLGFPLVTAAFIAGFMALSGARSPSAIGACAAAGTVALVWVFVRLVYLPLPKGDGPFESLTLALYRALRIF